MPHRLRVTSHAYGKLASSRNPALALCLHICHVRPPVLGPAVLNIALRHLCRRRLGERARPNGNASRSKKVFELFMAKRPRKERRQERTAHSVALLIAAWETHRRRFTFSFPRLVCYAETAASDSVSAMSVRERMSLGSTFMIAHIPFLSQVDVDPQFNASLLEQKNAVAISPGFPPGQSRSIDLLDAPTLSFLRNLSFALSFLPPLQHARMDVCPGFGTLNGEFSLTALTHIPGGGRNKWALSLQSLLWPETRTFGGGGGVSATTLIDGGRVY